MKLRLESLEGAVPWLTRLGYAAMLLGAVDPLEGALLILPGSALLLAGSLLSAMERQWVSVRAWALGSILFGVAAMWLLSRQGGIGEESGLAPWWGMLMLPYALGWWLDVFGTKSFRWVFWAGGVVGVWYCVLAAMIIWTGRESAGTESYVVSLVFGLFGLMIMIGCLYRLHPRFAR